MANRRFPLQFFIAPLLLALLAAWPAAHAAVGQQMTVQTQEAQVRQSPSFTSPVTAKLSYGDAVSVQEEKGDWVRVSRANAAGWVPKSAFAAAKAQMAAGRATAGAKVSEREVSMAGKGFGPETEKAYTKAHPEGYAAVAAMMRFSYTPGELEAFLVAGQQPKRGGAQ